MAASASDIRRFVLDRIARGGLKPGDRLPSRPELERRFRCARATVDRALADLRRERVIRTELGKGTYVAERRTSTKAASRRVIVIPELTRQVQRDLFVFGIYRELARYLSARDGIAQGTIEEPQASGGSDWDALAKSSMVYWVRSSPWCEPVMASLSGMGVPQLLLNRDYGRYPSITTDTAAGQREAVAYLASLGHRSIGYINLPTNPLRAFDAERMIGFLEGIHRAGIAPDCAPRIEVPEAAETRMERALAARFRAAEVPTAVIIPSHFSGPLVRAAATAGLKIPRDLSVLTIDEVHDPHGLYGMRFTCQRQRLAEIGRRAAETDPEDLLADGAPVKVRLPPTLVVGDTTARPASRRRNATGGSSRRKEKGT